MQTPSAPARRFRSRQHCPGGGWGDGCLLELKIHPADVLSPREGGAGPLRQPWDRRREDSLPGSGWPGEHGRGAHFKDLEASDVQDADERGALPLGLVQSLVDAQHQPAEHSLVGGLGQGLDGKVRLGGDTPRGTECQMQGASKPCNPLLQSIHLHGCPPERQP